MSHRLRSVRHLSASRRLRVLRHLFALRRWHVFRHLDRKIQKTLANLVKGKKADNGLPPNVYLDWYAGKKAGNERWPIVKDGEKINGKTGATITSRAVDGAIFAIGKTCLDNLEQLSKEME